MTRSLPDGTPIRIRPIRPDDKELLQTGLRDLSPRSVQLRFLAPKVRFSQAELRYLTEVDGRDHVALVAELPDDPGAFVAVGRFVRLRDDPGTAEVAIVVCDELQRRGLGSLLAIALADAARALGVRRFTASMLSENVPAHRLMAKLTERLEAGHDGRGVREVSADLAA